ncbi:MAG: hypothetical protein JW951_09965 [Lentisphaerae bacterium]|nr:hypothetical protein [Lentisphaerota bacterium]
MKNNLFCAFCLLAAAVYLGSGCVGYQLGSTLPPGIQSVYIATFVNETGEPRVEIEATRAAIQEFQKDGTLRVTGKNAADTLLTVTLVEYELQPLRYEEARRRTTEEYRLLLTADIVFERAATGEVLVSRRVRGETDFQFGGDLSSAKRANLPAASRDLAHDIVEAVTEYW